MMEYTIVLEPHDSGGYVARCLELPGAVSRGDTEELALENMRDAIDLIHRALRENLN